MAERPDHILLVDEDLALLGAVREALEGARWTVTPATSALRALGLLQQGPARYAAAVVNLMMPELNGYEFVERARRLVAGLPVVLMARPDQEHQIGPAPSVRTEVYPLRKPFEPAEAVAAVAAAMAQPQGKPAVPFQVPRRVPRYPCDLPIEYRLLRCPAPRPAAPAFLASQGRVVDISEIGAGVELEQSLSPAHLLAATIRFRGDAVQTQAEIVWASPPRTGRAWAMPHGIRFLDLTREMRSRLRRYIGIA